MPLNELMIEYVTACFELTMDFQCQYDDATMVLCQGK